MSLVRIRLQRLAVCTALLAAVGAPASAQSLLDTSQAQAFLGNWTIPLNTDLGAMTLQLNIVDQGGKVAATFGDPTQGMMANVTDITRSGEELHMNLFVDAQGQSIDVNLQLARDGEALNVSLAAMGGSFTATAVGTRASS
jgi:hypothetical protein